MIQYSPTDIPWAETFPAKDWIGIRCPHCGWDVIRPPSWFPLRGIQTTRCPKCMASYKIKKPPQERNCGV